MDALIGQMQGGLLPSVGAGPPAALKAGSPPSLSPTKAVTEQVDGKAQKAAKAEKKAKAAAAATEKKPSAEDRAIDVSWSDIRVGVILKAEPHPESEKVDACHLSKLALRSLVTLLPRRQFPRLVFWRLAVVC